MYVIEFSSDVDGNDYLVVNERDLVTKVLQIVSSFRRNGYSVFGGYRRVSKRFSGEYGFYSQHENVKMSIV